MQVNPRWTTSLVAAWTLWACANGSAQVQPPPAPHAAHDHANDPGHTHQGHLSEKDVRLPKDFSSAVVRIKTCRDLIREECEAQHFEAAHGPMDEASIILGKLMILARDSGVPKGQWQEVNLASKELGKRLAEIDDSLHKTGAVNYQKVSKPIDESLRRLEAIATKQPGARQTTNR